MADHGWKRGQRIPEGEDRGLSGVSILMTRTKRVDSNDSNAREILVQLMNVARASAASANTHHYLVSKVPPPLYPQCDLSPDKYRNSSPMSACFIPHSSAYISLVLQSLY